jgi:uncharacterized membrane protein YtjA (UPF0391 family)
MSYAQERRAPTATAQRIANTFATADGCHKITRGANMLHYAVVFFVIALIAAFFGFGGIAVGAAGIAKILFIVFLIGAVVTFLMSLGRRV